MYTYVLCVCVCDTYVRVCERERETKREPGTRPLWPELSLVKAAEVWSLASDPQTAAARGVMPLATKVSRLVKLPVSLNIYMLSHSILNHEEVFVQVYNGGPR